MRFAHHHGAEWLVGGGELAELIRSHDWSGTPFGPRDAWPAGLRTVVNLVVENRVPMALLWGRDLRLLYNDAYRVIASDRHPSALGRPTREVWPEVWHVNEPIFTAVMERGETVYLEHALFPVDRDGRRQDAWFTMCYSPVRDDVGNVAGTLVTLIETTGRERTLRDALHAAELERRRLAAVLEALPAGVAIVDESGRVLQYNAALERIWGAPPATGNAGEYAKWRGRFPDTGVPLEAGDWAMARALRTGEIVHGDTVEIDTFDGGTATIINAAAPVRDETGRIVGGVVAEVDITAQRRAEQRLSKRETTLAQAGKMAHLGAWDIEVRDPSDVNAGTLRWSDEVYRIFGYEPGSVAVTNALFFEHVHPDDRSAVGRGVSEAIASKRPYSVEHRIVRADGSERVVQEHAELLFDDAGALVQIIGAVQDITDRKRSEQALHEAARRKDEFLAMLGHELRNPLAPIRNSLYILDRLPSDDARARSARAVIERQVAHLTRIVGDLLDVSRIARGHMQLQRERIDVGGLVARTVEDYRALFDAAGVALHVVTPLAPVWIDGDATRLAQALGNLLHNAVKFTPRGGETRVVLTHHGASADLRVTDTGIGIAPAVVPRLFEPFTQADTSLDRASGGLGLGLSVVKGIVHFHGGHVRARSDGPGRGTEISVHLPAEHVDAPVSPGHPATGTAVQRRRVLVIDDNVDAAESLKEVLELIGHQVDVAFAAPQALAKARASLPDVVLCDIGLPGMDGYEVARAFRADASLRHVTLVALTGYAGPEDRDLAANAGFDHHLPKPPDYVAIERILARLRDP